MCKQRGQLWGDAGCSSNDFCRAVAHLGGQRMLSQSLLHGMRLKELLLQPLNARRRWIDFHLAPRTHADLLLLPSPSPFLPASVINSTFQIVGVLTPPTPPHPSTKSLNFRQSFSAAAPFAVWIRPGGRPGAASASKCCSRFHSICLPPCSPRIHPGPVGTRAGERAAPARGRHPCKQTKVKASATVPLFVYAPSEKRPKPLKPNLKKYQHQVKCPLEPAEELQ